MLAVKRRVLRRRVMAWYNGTVGWMQFVVDQVLWVTLEITQAVRQRITGCLHTSSTLDVE